MTQTESYNEKTRLINILIHNINANDGKIVQLRDSVNNAYEDGIYRYYHTSFKVYHLQHYTTQMVDFFKSLSPENAELNPTFLGVVENGTGKEWTWEHNNMWDVATHPMMMAFFHAKYFLDMMDKFRGQFKTCPDCLEYGFAGILYLYNLR